MPGLSSRSRLWLLLLFALLGAGLWWTLGSGFGLDTKNRVRVDEDPTGKVVAQAPDETVAREISKLEDPDGSRRPVGRRMESEGSPSFGIEGRVVDVLGKGLSGLRVSANDLNVLLIDGPRTATIAESESGEGGHFRLAGVRGTRVFLFAERESGEFGTVFVDREAVAGWIRDLEIRVLPGCVARGRIVDPVGAPIEGAWILPTPDRDARYRYWQAREVRSDEEGRFEVRGLPPGGFRLSAWARDYRLGLIHVEKDHVGKNLEIRLLRGPSIALPCRIEAKKDALAGFLALEPRVQIHWLEREGHNWALPSPFRGLRFDEGGRCEFRGLLAGKVTARLGAAGDTFKSIWQARQLEEGQLCAEIVWRPAQRLALEAWLQDEAGRPLPGIRVFWYGDSQTKTVRSDAQGRILIEEFSPEGQSNYLTLETPGWYFETARGPKTMKAVKPGSGQVFPLRQGPLLAGQVLTADGKPAAGAQVVLTPDEPRTRKVLGVSDCDAEGRFRMTPHWPTEAMAVRLAARLGSRLAIHPEALNLRSSSRLEGITLRLREGARLTGRLVREDRRPAIGQALNLEPVQVDWLQLWDWQGGETVCDTEGRFSFAGMPTGTWKLSVRQGERVLDKAPIWVELTIGKRKDVGTILVRKGLAIAGKVLDLEGKPHPGKILSCASRLILVTDSGKPKSLSRYGKVNRDGTFRIEGLSGGTYQLLFQFMESPKWTLPDVPKVTFPGLGSLEQYRVRAEAGQTDLEFRVAQPGFGNLEVRILPDVGGWVPSGVFLELKDPVPYWHGGEQHVSVKQGLIRVQGIRTGSYQLRIVHPRFGRLRQNLLIQKGRTSEAIVDLRRLTRQIQIRVQDESHKAIVGAWVGMVPLIGNKQEIDDPWGLYWRPSRRRQGELKSDGQGQASLLATAAGQGLVMVWKEGFVPFAQRVQGGAGPITVKLRKSSVVRFQLTKKTLGATSPEQPWSMRLRLLSSQVRHHDPRLDKGVTFLLYGMRRNHSLDTLPAGRYQLEGWRPGAKQNKSGGVVAEIQREFRLEAGKPLELDL